MSPHFQSIQKEALELPFSEREKLAEQLVQSLQDSTDSIIEHKWFQAAEERYKAYSEGKSEVFEVQEVVELLRKKMQ